MFPSHDLANSKNSLIKSIDDKIAQLNIQKRIDNTVQSQIDELELYKKNVDSQYSGLQSLSFTNPEEVRATLYKNDVYNRYVTMFGEMKTKTQILSNPGAQYTFDLLKEKNRVLEWRERMDFDKEKEKWDRTYKLLLISS